MRDELAIPDGAFGAGEAALRGYPIADSEMLDAASEVLQAAAPLIVAAELRRLAAALDAQAADAQPGQRLPEPFTLVTVAAQLRRRADELDPPTRGLDGAQ